MSKIDISMIYSHCTIINMQFKRTFKRLTKIVLFYYPFFNKTGSHKDSPDQTSYFWSAQCKQAAAAIEQLDIDYLCLILMFSFLKADAMKPCQMFIITLLLS